MVKKVRTINLISNLNTEKGLNSKFLTFNMSVGYFLGQALRKKGVKCNIVQDRRPSSAPKADHTIALSLKALLSLRGTSKGGKEFSDYIKKKCRAYMKALYMMTC